MDKHIQKIDENIYNERSLSLLNLTELRNVARTLGVGAPTLKSKTELIKSILDVVYGKVERSSGKNSGRPSKANVNIEESLKKIRDKAYSRDKALNFSYDESDFGTIKVAAPSAAEDYFRDDELETRVISVQGDKFFMRKYGFLESADDMEIAKDVAKALKLENLDVVEVVFVEDFYRIVSINGERVSTRLDGFKIQDEVLRGGQKRFFYLSTKEKVREEILKIIDRSKVFDSKVYIFSKTEYVGENIVNVTYGDGDVGSAFYKKFYSFLEECGQSIVKNESFVLVVENMPDVERIIDDFEEDISVRVKIHIERMFTRFAKLGNLIITFRLETKKYF